MCKLFVPWTEKILFPTLARFVLFQSYMLYSREMCQAEPQITIGRII